MKKPRHLAAPGSFRSGKDGSAILEHDRLTATLPVTDLQRDLLALLDILHTGTLQNGGMQEHVLAAIVRRHEAEAAHLVEPLDGATDGVGRATLVAAEVTARRRTVAEIAARRAATVAEATAEAATVTEVTARRTVAEATTIAEAATRRATVAEATAEAATVAEVTARRTVTEIAAGRTIAEATTGMATGALLQLGDAGHQAASLAVRADLANQLVARLGGLNAGFGQGRCVEENVLAIGAKHKAEAFTPVIPLHLGLDGAGATLGVVVGKHCLFRLRNFHGPTECRTGAMMVARADAEI